MTPTERKTLINEIRREYQQRNYATARIRCEHLLNKSRKDAEALYLMGSILHASRRMDEAAPYLERAAAIEPRNIGILLALARVLTYRPGKLRSALRRVDAALKLEPDRLEAIQIKAQLLDMNGDPEAAKAVLEPAAEQHPHAPDVGYYLARSLHNLGERDAAISLLRTHVERADEPAPDASAPDTPIQVTAPQRRRLGFQLGQYLERAGAYDDAFEAYRSTNEHDPAPYDADENRRAIDEIINTFSADFLATAPRAQHGLDQPVLIVGMPRTGSTLLEQILDRHPMVHGTGENAALLNVIDQLPLNITSQRPYPAVVHDMTQSELDDAGRAYVQALQSGPGRRAKRLVDKALINYENIGLLSLIVPEARIIDCRRDPVNTCFSCYTADLDVHTFPYTSRLESLAEHYRQYARLMDHWHRVGGGKGADTGMGTDTGTHTDTHAHTHAHTHADADTPPPSINILRVQYEHLVNDLEGTTRTILNFLDLPWEPKCLTFHESKTAAVTLSNEQVRQPIYNRSIDRAAPFAKHLTPLHQALTTGSTSGST